MAGQFDKFVKILGTGSKPDRFKGAVERDPETNKVTRVNPDMVAPMEINVNSTTTDNTNRSLPANAPKKAAADAASKQEAGVNFHRKYYGRNLRKRQIAGLNTTTMRLDESTGEAYDTEDVKPTPSGRVMPTRQANPKYLAADAQRENEDRAARDAADRARNVGEPDPTGENAFNASQIKLDKSIQGNKARRRSGSSLRSLNGVTYDVMDLRHEVMTAKGGAGDFGTYKDDLIAAGKSSDGIPAATTSSTSTSTVNSTPTEFPVMGDPVFKKVDKITARRGGTVHSDKAVRDFETEHPDSDASSTAAGKTLSEKNKKSTFPKPVQKVREQITEPATAVVEGDIAGAAYEQVPDPKRPGYSIEGPNVAAGYDDPNDIRSTTMREVPAEGPAKVLEHILVAAPSQPIPYEKPTVNKPGNVIPLSAINTHGNREADKKQAERERKLHVKNQTVPTTTTILDPNERPAAAVAGQTPERSAIDAAIREDRVASLAAEGKEMTTVAPEVMATAKGLGRTSMYNLDEDYMNSTSFLAHPAIQKATVAHALGVHHLLGTDKDLLHAYLGGRPLIAKDRLAAAFKVVDRNRRGNPEKIEGEFNYLRAMVHGRSNPTKLLRDIKQGNKTDVVVNGQSVTLPEGSSENRNVTHAKASKLTAALGSIAATPVAPLAGSNRVAVRNVGQPEEDSVIREFSPAELRNKGRVPKTDDSKGPHVTVDASGLRPGEANTNKTLKEEKDS